MVTADAIRTVVGILGNAIALGLFLSPVPTFYRIWKKGSVEQFSPAPYVFTLLNCLFWVLYGLPLVHPGSILVLTINGSGTLIELFYVFLFILYSEGPQRLRVLLILVAEIAFVGAVAVFVLETSHDHERRSLIVGILCVFFGTLMYAAPLSVMKLVIQTKSVEYMPLFLSLASFFNGACWTTYALIRFDLFITLQEEEDKFSMQLVKQIMSMVEQTVTPNTAAKNILSTLSEVSQNTHIQCIRPPWEFRVLERIPNGLGVLFAVAQLVLHAMYYKSTRRMIEARKRKAGTELIEIVAMGETTNNNTCKQEQNGHQPQIQVT